MELVFAIVISFILGAKTDSTSSTYIPHLVQNGFTNIMFHNNIYCSTMMDLFKSRTVNTAEVTLNLYTKDTSNIISKDSYPIATAGIDILNSPKFKKNLPIIIYCHGFLESADFQGTASNIKAFLDIGGLNVFAVNAQSVIGMIYALAAKAVEFVGSALGKVLNTFYAANIKSTENVHLVGFSLGAHIAGFAGKIVQLNGNMVNQITGLDPAGPCIPLDDDKYRLNMNDATFVDIIHTDAGVFGINKSIGDVDFWPNGGYAQPDAWISHLEAYKFYAQSVKDRSIFLAEKCGSWKEYITSNNCSMNLKTHMGYWVEKTALGSYYLKT